MSLDTAHNPPSAADSSGVSLQQLLDDDVLTATVAAGHGGLTRMVRRINVMEVPDILDFVKPNELLVTTAYPLRERQDDLASLVEQLDDVGLAGLGIKLGRYLDELPEQLVATANARNFPVLLLEADSSFDEILNDVLSHVLSDQSARLQQSERIHRTFLQLVVAGGGLDEITQQLTGLVNAPSAIISLDGDVLAEQGFHDIIADVREELGPAFVTPEEHRGKDRDFTLSTRTGHLRIGPEHLAVELAPAAAGPRLFGHVVVVPPQPTRPGRPQPEVPSDHRMALESAATVAALALTMQSEIVAVESKYQSDLMHDLLTGRIASTADALRRARAFGWDLDRPLITAVLKNEDASVTMDPISAGSSPLRTTFGTLLRQRDPKATVVRFSEEIVVLTTPFDGEEGRDQARDFLSAQLAEASRTADLVVNAGLSRPVQHLEDIPRGYDQAVSALRVGRRIHGPGNITHFDDLGAHRVLALIDDVDELRSFASEVLGPLAADDDATADLRSTLKILLATNLNVAESARQLHFHYNTLRYRIDKLREMVGNFMEDADVRLSVQLALLIHDMRGL